MGLQPPSVIKGLWRKLSAAHPSGNAPILSWEEQVRRAAGVSSSRRACQGIFVLMGAEVEHGKRVRMVLPTAMLGRESGQHRLIQSVIRQICLSDPEAGTKHTMVCEISHGFLEAHNHMRETYTNQIIIQRNK